MGAFPSLLYYGDVRSRRGRSKMYAPEPPEGRRAVADNVTLLAAPGRGRAGLATGLRALGRLASGAHERNIGLRLRWGVGLRPYKDYISAHPSLCIQPKSLLSVGNSMGNTFLGKQKSLGQFHLSPCFISGSGAGIRTPDTWIMIPLL